MTSEELLRLHEQTCNTARVIMEAKSKDYSGGSNDPFSNFKDSIVFGIEPEHGLLIRVMDKLKRISTFIKKGELAVKDEPVEDAIHDIINYMILLKGMIQDKKKDSP